MKKEGTREGNIMRKTRSVVVLIIVAMLLSPVIFISTAQASLNTADDSNGNHEPAFDFAGASTIEIANLSCTEISALGTAIDNVLHEEWKLGSIRKPVLIRAQMLAGEAESVGSMFSGLPGFFRKLLASSGLIDVKPPEKIVTLTEETEIAVQFIEYTGTECLTALGPVGKIGAAIAKILSPVAQWGAKEWAEWRSLDASLLRVTKPGVGTMDVIYSKELGEASVIITLDDFEEETKAKYGWEKERLYLSLSFDTKPPNLRKTDEGFDYKIALRSEEVQHAMAPSEPPQAPSPTPPQNGTVSSTTTRMVATGNAHTVGLKSNGTVVAVGYNVYGQCDVNSWTDITHVAAGSHTVGLKSDGTVVAVGYNDCGQCDVNSWTGITQVAAGTQHTVGLKSDGSVVAVGEKFWNRCNVGTWTNITQVAAGSEHTVGLKSDGTVVAVGLNSFGQRDVSTWTNITQVAAGSEHTVGLKSDGSVVAVGLNSYGTCDVSTWTNIIQVAAGYNHTVGLKSDGTVVAVGHNAFGQCNVSTWTNITQVAAGYLFTVGLKSDGTVVAVGHNRYGQCNVDGWNLGPAHR
jgi:hypothetical protein